MKKQLKFLLLPLLVLCGCAPVENDYAYVDNWVEEWSAWNGKMVINTPKDPENADKLVSEFIRGLELFAPYMLEEFAILDKKLNLAPGTALKRNIFGTNMKVTPPPHECTSWIIMPELLGGKQIILHKNRDSSTRYITAFQTAVPGKYAWIGNGNYGGPFTTSGINEKALAVAMNSGARTNDPGLYGLGTTIMARIILENCATVDEAVAMLKKMMDAKVYYHGKVTGSIWFFADRNGGCVIEQSANHMGVEKVTSGLAVRGNHWYSAPMRVYSTSTPEEMMDNAIRNFHVQYSLICQSYNKNNIITMADIARTARINHFPEPGKQWYPLCGKATNVSSTFVIDLEYPEELSSFTSTFGPPRHGIYLPIPLTIDQLPLEMRNGAWSEALFDRKEAGQHPDLTKVAEIEAKLQARHQQAVEEARKVLRNGGSKAEAAAILKAAFEENFREAKSFKFTFVKETTPENNSTLFHI